MLSDLPPFLARAARHLPDQLLHPWRRGRARRRIALRPPPRVILFVCHGNICRSPYAAAAARRLLPKDIRVESAGFLGSGRPSSPTAADVAGERGLDLARHRSRVIAAELLRDADLILVMDDHQQRLLAHSLPDIGSRIEVLGDLDPEPIKRRTVPDPVDQPAEAFRASFDRIDRCVGALRSLIRPTEDS